MIWCIERDTTIRNLQIHTLRSFGFEAAGFENEDAFRNAMGTETPDMVLLSLSSDGLNLLKELRETDTTRNIPVIVTSGRSEYDVVSCLNAGADDCMRGSFERMELIARVKAVFRRYD